MAELLDSLDVGRSMHPEELVQGRFPGLQLADPVVEGQHVPADRRRKGSHAPLVIRVAPARIVERGSRVEEKTRP